MDAVTVVNPLVEEVAPVAAEQMMKVLYTTGNIIVIETKDLKTFAIRAGVAVAYVGFMRWQWKKQWQPMLEEHREHKRFKKAQKQRDDLEAARDKAAEKFLAENRKAKDKLR